MQTLCGGLQGVCLRSGAERPQAAPLAARHALAGARPQAASTAGRRSLRASALACRAEAATAVTVSPLGADVWNKTYYPKAVDHVPTEKTWVVIDAAGQRLGRLAVLAATYLRGANKASYTPSVDMGSCVVVINCEQVAVTGRKRTQKMYVRHTTGRPGGMAVESFEALQKRIPTRIVEEAVWGMIPKEKLGRTLYSHLHVYKGAEHPHAAQQPLDITCLIDTTDKQNKAAKAKAAVVVVKKVAA